MGNTGTKRKETTCTEHRGSLTNFRTRKSKHGSRSSTSGLQSSEYPEPRGEMPVPAMVERMDFKSYMMDMCARNASRTGRLNGVYAVSLHSFRRNFTSGFGIELPGCRYPAYACCARIDMITNMDNKMFACHGRDGIWVYNPELFDGSASLICDALAPALEFIRAGLPKYEPENILDLMDFVEIRLLMNWS